VSGPIGDPTPSVRAAGLLFARALQRVDQVEPPSIRGPITSMLEAGVELCAISTSLFGKPVNHLLALARGLTEGDQ
jgi:hypothetical protein